MKGPLSDLAVALTPGLELLLSPEGKEVGLHELCWERFGQWG